MPPRSSLFRRWKLCAAPGIYNLSLKSEQNEIEEILFRLLDNLSATVPSQTGREGAQLRHQIGRVRGDYMKLLSNDGFAIALLTCFKLAEQAKVGLLRLARVREQLFKEQPVGDISTSLVMSAITFCLGTESRLALLLTFTSREDVELVLKRMKKAFDIARDLAADAMDSDTYQKLTFLAGAVTNHLATAARPLPSMVTFHLAYNFPALTVSYRLYQAADRAEQLVAENHIVHPAFMLRDLRGLTR
jgi:hypothetical protein